jgi:hypothetical protein
MEPDMTKNNRYQPLGRLPEVLTERVWCDGRVDAMDSPRLPRAAGSVGATAIHVFRPQPTVVDGRIFIGSDSVISTLMRPPDAALAFQAQAGLRSTPMIGPLSSEGQPVQRSSATPRQRTQSTRPAASSCGERESMQYPGAYHRKRHGP